MIQAIEHPGSHMLIVPDSVLSIARHQPGVQFQFDPMHRTYKQLLGLPHPNSTGANVTVAVLDTGLDPQTGIATTAASRAFHDDTNTTTIDDHNGHGTVVASIIHDTAPDAQLLVLKVGDGNPISEWNVLAALLAAHSADVVNMSLAFGMPFRSCQVCGRGQTHSSRSAVFEQAVNEFLRLLPESIIVAAAGNRKQNALDFPARFGDVVAVGAVDSHLNRPAYSNYGARNHIGGPHGLLFFAPGGGNGEFVASTTAPGHVQHEGTSFAAPYVSALVALHLGQGGTKPNRASTLTHFARRANQNFASYVTADFGNGFIRV